MTTPIIRFPQGLFSEMRRRLLDGSCDETFAFAVGKRTESAGLDIIRVIDVAYPQSDDYEDQSPVSLRLKREFIFAQLVKLRQGTGADTVIDVHTHPFCSRQAAFSTADDADEREFHRWLVGTLGGIHYASIVLSQSDYAARIWTENGSESQPISAVIKTQLASEGWRSAETQFQISIPDEREIETGILARSSLALGLDTLRQIMTDQTIAVIGVGGLGSVIAENLVHSGFQSIHLIDPDHVEISNLNRIVGAYYTDAAAGRLKVDVVRDHLTRINPMAKIEAHPLSVEDEAVLPLLGRCDWLMVATDTHFSRYQSQRIALQLGIPLISAGVNITVDDRQIADMSGEVVIARTGDSLCLNCLGRINPTLVAAQSHRGTLIESELVERGYVRGVHIKEPAVKTLNSTVGALAVDMLINQYTQRQPHKPVWVYENNKQHLIYADDNSVINRPKNCYFCC